MNRRPPPPPHVGAPPRSLAPPPGERGVPKQTWLLAAAALLIVVGIGLFWATHRTGALILTVSGPGGQAVDHVEIQLDGEVVCESSPCKVESLSPEPHLVRAKAGGYEPTADQAVVIEAGKTNSHHVTLTTPVAKTGIKVTAAGDGLKLYIDGQEVGELPQELDDMDPGEHIVKVGGNSRYQPWEDHVTVKRGEMTEIGPLKLTVDKGLVTIKAGSGADGARVSLDGRRIQSLPSTIEMPADEEHELVARKSGYGTYRRTITFDDGVAEKTIEIMMVETDTSEPAPPVAHHRASPRPRRSSPRPSRKQASGSTAGKATINMNSIPVSNVILNGRPLGSTPKVGVQVPAGMQTVVFVHPQHGRKVVSATVPAGGTKTFMARFP